MCVVRYAGRVLFQPQALRDSGAPNPQWRVQRIEARGDAGTDWRKHDSPVRWHPIMWPTARTRRNTIWVNADDVGKLNLCATLHKKVLCVKSDIDVLSVLTHINSMNDLARDPKQIGNLIRRARKQRALSQKALGDKAGLRQETISLIESGNAAAKIKTLLAVLAALDLEFRITPRSKGGLGLESEF